MRIETQQYFLSSVSLDLSLLNELTRLTYKPNSDDFSGEHKKWFNLLFDLKEKQYDRINDETLKQHNIQTSIDNIEDPKLTVLNIINQYQNKKADVNVNQTSQELVEQLNKIQNSQMGVEKKEKKLKDVLTKLKDHRFITDKSNSKTTKELSEEYGPVEEQASIPTYLQDIDTITNGGFRRSGTNVISAESGVGKTTFAIQAAVMQAMNNYNVLYLSLEQSKEPIFDQMISVAAEGEKLNRTHFMRNNIVNDEDADFKRRQAIEIVNKTIQDRVRVEENDEDTFETVESVIQRLYEASFEGFDIVYIDNFQNLQLGETKEYNRFAAELLKASKNTGMAIVPLSQITLNEKTGKKKTTNAKKLEFDATVHLEIQEVKPEEEEMEIPPQRKIVVLKNRFGKKKLDDDLIFAFNGEKGIIGEIQKPNDLSQQFI